MDNSGRYPDNSFYQVVQQVRASIMPEVEKTVGDVRRHCDGIIGRVQRVERRQTEQQEEMDAWKAKTEEIDAKLHELSIKCEGNLDRVGRVINFTKGIVDDIERMKTRMDALDISGEVGTWTPMSPSSNPPTPGPAAPHGAGISGPRIQRTSDVLGAFGRAGTMASPILQPQANPANLLSAHTLETRAGYERCPFCLKELKKQYMKCVHRRKYCKKSPFYVKPSPRG